MIDLGLLAVEWLLVFGINVIPAFAPPTWVMLAFFYISYSQNLLILVLLGVTASTCGRFVLAKLSELFTERFAGRERKEDLQFLSKKLSGKPWKKFIFTFAFALSPLPSNMLFIAVGVLGLRLREILLGFFIGRFLSYLFLVFTTNEILTLFEVTASGSGSMLMILVEVIGFVAIIAFFLFDWEKLLGKPQHKSPIKWKHAKEKQKY